MSQTEHSSVARVKAAFATAGIAPEVRTLSETARTAIDAALALDVEVGQIASSIVFSLKTETAVVPVLVVTSGRHRVNTDLVCEQAALAGLGRADADFVRMWSGFAIGGVSPLGWIHDGVLEQPLTFVDKALADYDAVWAAAGHTHVVYRTTFHELLAATGGTALEVARD
ncbi:MAG: YbaK/EbsC family protein [Actinobacteria bacterium]|uniref:Unannotated protein n=1 Tax=freshwater metagenome TaxID=449393 RepID=A0A6J5ZCP7_9ZZZZ|nr:YbaK/EbsC family protein [Actinomycetota bacterium]